MSGACVRLLSRAQFAPSSPYILYGWLPGYLMAGSVPIMQGVESRASPHLCSSPLYVRDPCRSPSRSSTVFRSVWHLCHTGPPPSGPAIPRLCHAASPTADLAAGTLQVAGLTPRFQAANPVRQSPSLVLTEWRVLARSPVSLLPWAQVRRRCQPAAFHLCRVSGRHRFCCHHTAVPRLPHQFPCTGRGHEAVRPPPTGHYIRIMYGQVWSFSLTWQPSSASKPRPQVSYGS